MTDEPTVAAALMPKAQETGAWMDLVQHALHLALRTDYLSSQSGSQKRHRVLFARSSRRRAQTAHRVGTDLRHARRMTEWDSERVYLQEVALRERLTSSEEYRLAVRMRAGDTAARNALLEANLGLVVMLARRWRHADVPMIDLIAEGNMGLLAATRGFDPELGFRFATYAKWFVLHSLNRARPRLTLIGPALASPAEAGASEAEAQEPGRPFECRAGASAQAHERDESIDDLRIPEEEEPPQVAILQQRRALLRQALARLDAREQMVVAERYALFDERGVTLNELALRLNLSIERVRQIEVAAMSKLRKALCEGD